MQAISSPIRTSLSIVLIIILLRAFSLGQMALVDTTEGRYGQIAQEMYHSGDYVTPRLHMKEDLVPYSGKPPLYFWLGALSFYIFGDTEVSPRFPSFLAGLFMIASAWIFASRFISRTVALDSMLILASSIFFFYLSGAAVIDTVLAGSVAGAMLSAGFALPVSGSNTNARTRYFAGLTLFFFTSLGFLTKGPVAVILCVGPLFFWAFFQKNLRSLLSLPWIAGGVLFVVVSAPWFYFAEKAAPGFLTYFIWNENILRFITKDYLDRYGVGHVATRGMSWFWTWVAFLPWTIIAPIAWLRSRKSEKAAFTPHEHLALWYGLMAPLFFTAIRQLTPIYIVPALTGGAIALASWIRKSETRSARAAEGCIWAVRVALALCIVTLPLGIVVKAAPAHLILCATIFVILFVVLKRMPKESLTDSMSRVALSCTVLFFSVAILGSTYLSAKNSTRGVLEAITKKYGGKEIEAAIYFGNFGNPFSVWFYNEYLLETKFKIKEFDSKELEKNPSLIILKSDQYADRDPAFSAVYEKIEKVGRWTYFKKRLKS